MNIFDWLHDVTKGEDTLRPKFIRVLIILVVIGILCSLWNYYY